MGKLAPEVEKAMQKFLNQDEAWIKQSRVAYGGLIGIGVVLIQPFLISEDLDTSALVCVVAFAVAIPLLAALILLSHEESYQKHIAKSFTVTFAKMIGQLSAFIGLVAGFWHIHWIAGAAVIASSILGMSAHSAGYVTLFRKTLEP